MEHKINNYIVKRAGYDELPGIIDLSRRFHLESNFKDITTFNPAKLQDNLLVAWANKPADFRTFCAYHGNKMVGYCHATRDDFATDESTGSIYQFYVIPEYRRTGAARALRDATEEQFTVWDCKLRYAECGCGFDDKKNDVLFFNLWAKIGYQFLGTSLFKKG